MSFGNCLVQEYLVRSIIRLCVDCAKKSNELPATETSSVDCRLHQREYMEKEVKRVEWSREGLSWERSPSLFQFNQSRGLASTYSQFSLHLSLKKEGSTEKLIHQWFIDLVNIFFTLFFCALFLQKCDHPFPQTSVLKKKFTDPFGKSFEEFLDENDAFWWIYQLKEKSVWFF